MEAEDRWNGLNSFLDPMGQAQQKVVKDYDSTCQSAVLK